MGCASWRQHAMPMPGLLRRHWRHVTVGPGDEWHPYTRTANRRKLAKQTHQLEQKSKKIYSPTFGQGGGLSKKSNNFNGVFVEWKGW